MKSNRLFFGISIKAFLIIGLIFTLFSWFGVISLIWALNKYQHGDPTVKFLDLALPSRWAAYRIGKGNFYIDRAKQALTQRDYPHALNLLRKGIEKSPANIEGRLLLADFYLASKRPDLAKKLIENKIPDLLENPHQLSETLSLFFSIQEDNLVFQHASKLLTPPTELPVNLRHMLGNYAAHAAFNLGNYTEAEQIIRAHLDSNSPEAIALLAQIDWERGYQELALLRLRSGIDSTSEAAQLRALQSRYYREANRPSEWETSVVERMIADPFSFETRIEYLHMQYLRGNREKERAEVENYLDQFGLNQRAILLLADYAANTGQPALTIRAQQLLGEKGDVSGAASLMIAEAHIAAGEFQAALDLIQTYAQKFPEWSAQYAPVFNGLQAVACYGIGKKEEARLHLDALFVQSHLRADNLIAISKRLSALGAKDLTRLTLTRAAQADPLNEAALNSLLEAELDSGENEALPAHLERLLTMRKPSRKLAAQAYRKLGSDENLFLPAQAKLLTSLAAVLEHPRP